MPLYHGETIAGSGPKPRVIPSKGSKFLCFSWIFCCSSYSSLWDVVVSGWIYSTQGFRKPEWFLSCDYHLECQFSRILLQSVSRDREKFVKKEDRCNGVTCFRLLVYVCAFPNVPETALGYGVLGQFFAYLSSKIWYIAQATRSQCWDITWMSGKTNGFIWLVLFLPLIESNLSCPSSWRNLLFNFSNQRITSSETGRLPISNVNGDEPRVWAVVSGSFI